MRQTQLSYVGLLEPGKRPRGPVGRRVIEMFLLEKTERKENGMGLSGQAISTYSEELEKR